MGPTGRKWGASQLCSDQLELPAEKVTNFSLGGLCSRPHLRGTHRISRAGSGLLAGSQHSTLTGRHDLLSLLFPQGGSEELVSPLPA